MQVRITRAEIVQAPDAGPGGSLRGSLARISSKDGVQAGSYAEYGFGVFADSDTSTCLHAICGRYSSLRASYSQLPASVPGCTAKFPDKRLVQDGVFQERRKEGDIGKRAQALRDFFAEMLLENEASEAANVRLHRQMDIPEATSRLLLDALVYKQSARADFPSPRSRAKVEGGSPVSSSGELGPPPLGLGLSQLSLRASATSPRASDTSPRASATSPRDPPPAPYRRVAQALRSTCC